MNRILLLLLLVFASNTKAEAPFNRGVNLTGWLQKSGPRQIQFTQFTKQDLINIKNLGCDVIRLPIHLHAMAGGAPDYTIDPLFFYFLDQIISWAEELQLHLILDNHTFSSSEDTDPNIGTVLVPVWRQMAEHYKNRSTYLYYEVLNEPHGIADAAWNQIQKSVIEAIRTVDQKHSIIIGPAGWNSYNNLKYMPAYDDDNLIYTFHFYDPFLFTHQGASWTDPSMVPLSGVPFPYDAARMPDLPAELVGTWIQSSLNNYANDGTVARVKALIDIAVDFQTARNVSLLCGEFGVYIPNSANDDRVYWYNVVRSYLEEKNIAWTIWDYKGGFGLFEAGTNELFDYDLNIPLVEALGLNPPAQKEYVLRPDSTDIELYGDYIGPSILEASWVSVGTLDYYSENNPRKGSYCIYWTGVGQYSNIGLDFNPNKDLSRLVNDGYVIDFWVRGDTPDTRFDIRFIDTKTDNPDDHPWRMRLTIDENLTAWDDQWQHVRVPLSDFTEHGSWDNETWFVPQGDFDWAAVDRFEIVSEHHDLQNIQFWFDNMRILSPGTDGTTGEVFLLPAGCRLYQNYPNPFNNTTMIDYQISMTTEVELSIYNLMGQKVETLLSQRQQAGKYQVEWDASGFASGIYYYFIKTGEFRQVKKMVLIH
jgi:endoglucanase